MGSFHALPPADGLPGVVHGDAVPMAGSTSRGPPSRPRPRFFYSHLWHFTCTFKNLVAQKKVAKSWLVPVLHLHPLPPPVAAAVWATMSGPHRRPKGRGARRTAERQVSRRRRALGGGV